MVQLLSPNRLTDEFFKGMGRLIQKPLGRATICNQKMQFWDSVGVFSTNDLISIGYLEVKKTDFTFNEMERHIQTEELLIPVSGTSMVAMAEPNEPDINLPKKVKTFILDSSMAILIGKGVWHWVPFPLGDSAAFLVIFRQGTPADDLEIVNFKEKFGISFEISI